MGPDELTSDCFIAPFTGTIRDNARRGGFETPHTSYFINLGRGKTLVLEDNKEPNNVANYANTANNSVNNNSYIWKQVKNPLHKRNLPSEEELGFELQSKIEDQKQPQ